MNFGEGQQADKRQKSANGEAVGDGQIGALASLMQYGSDDDGGGGGGGTTETSTRANGLAGKHTYCPLQYVCSHLHTLREALDNTSECSHDLTFSIMMMYIAAHATCLIQSLLQLFCHLPS